MARTEPRRAHAGPLPVVARRDRGVLAAARASPGGELARARGHRRRDAGNEPLPRGLPRHRHGLARQRGDAGLQSRPVHIPYFMRHVNRVFTNPVLGTIAWVVPPFAVIHHIGRKSHRKYRTPVVAFHGDAGFVVPMTYGRDVDWARNIVRARGCELERLGRRVKTRNPRIVSLGAAEHRLPAALRPFFRAADFPGFVLLDEAGKT